MDVYTFRLLPNERGIYHYRHRSPPTSISPNQFALYLASTHTYLPSYPITNNEPKLTLITVVLFVFFLRVLKICCKCRTCHDTAHLKGHIKTQAGPNQIHVSQHDHCSNFVCKSERDTAVRPWSGILICGGFESLRYVRS